MDGYPYLKDSLDSGDPMTKISISPKDMIMKGLQISFATNKKLVSPMNSTWSESGPWSWGRFMNLKPGKGEHFSFYFRAKAYK